MPQLFVVSMISTKVISFLALMEILSICNKNSSNRILGNLEISRESLHVDRRTKFVLSTNQAWYF